MPGTPGPYGNDTSIFPTVPAGTTGTNTGGGYAGPAWAGVKKGAKDVWDNWLNPKNEFNAGYLHPDPEVAGTLKTWALTGQGPSAAQDLIAAERAKNIAAAQSMAKSTPGVSHAGQQRLAQMGASRSIAEAASKGATLRSQEQQQAMQNQLDQYRTMAQAYADAMRANAQVAAENAGTRRGILGGAVKGITGLFGL